MSRVRNFIIGGLFGLGCLAIVGGITFAFAKVVVWMLRFFEPDAVMLILVFLSAFVLGGIVYLDIESNRRRP